jgi:hypothetical protein
MAAQAPAVLQPLRVFVASPGGIEDERQAARDIAEELNVPVHGRGWEIVVPGWEDRGPTAGRAQAGINSDVRLCDVFVGILWDRWNADGGEHVWLRRGLGDRARSALRRARAGPVAFLQEVAGARGRARGGGRAARGSPELPPRKLRRASSSSTSLRRPRRVRGARPSPAARRDLRSQWSDTHRRRRPRSPRRKGHRRLGRR